VDRFATEADYIATGQCIRLWMKFDQDTAVDIHNRFNKKHSYKLAVAGYQF